MGLGLVGPKTQGAGRTSWGDCGLWDWLQWLIIRPKEQVGLACCVLLVFVMEHK